VRGKRAGGGEIGGGGKKEGRISEAGIDACVIYLA